MSTGIDTVDAAPLIIRTYNDDSADNTFILTRYDYPVSSNFVLRTSANGSMAPSDALTQTTMGLSSITISNHYGSTMVYGAFSSSYLFLPSGVYDTITKDTMTASSVTASTIYLNVLNICTMNASTFSPNGVFVSYLTIGSTVQVSSMTYSTLVGNSLFVNTVGVSTLVGSSLYGTLASVSTTASDTSLFSTLTTSSTSVGTLSFSTLNGSTLVVSTLSSSSIYTNPLVVSTLDGGLLTTSTVSCASTISVSSLYASGLTFSTTVGTSVIMSTTTAPLLFSNSLFFSTAQGSTVVVSSVAVSSIYAPLLVGSTIQANTFAFSTLTASTINTSNIVYSTAQGSTMTVSTIGVSTLIVSAVSYSTLSGSSMTTNTVGLSTLMGSTISWNRLVLSTFQGSSALVSSVTTSSVVGGVVNAALLQGSTVLVSTFIGSSLNTSLLVGSTMTADSLFFSTLSISTLLSGSSVYSTLQGSTTTLSTLTVSTLSVSTIAVSTLSGSTVFGNVITASSIQFGGFVFSTLNGSTVLLSTLTSCTINAQTISVSTLQGSTIGVSTILGSTIVSGQISYSTLIGSSIVTDYISAASTFTGTGSLFISTFSFAAQQTSAAFLSTLIVNSTVTVSTLNRINPTSVTASTLVLSGGLQSNTASGLLVCSTLTVNAMNLTRSIINQPVYGNTVKTDSVAASGWSVVKTSGIRASIDTAPSQPQTYSFGPAIPNRWIAGFTTTNTLAYSNDGLTWIGLGTAITGGGRIAIWNGSMWVAVGDTAAISPALSGITANTWTQSGVTWTATASSTLSGWAIYNAFNGTVGSDGNAWAAGTNNYNTSGTYTGTITTTVNGIPSSVSFPSPSSGTSVAGEWLQLQASTPLSISSYTWGSANVINQAKSFCLVGSNDGSTWYFIQYVVYASSPCTTGYAAISTPIFAYYTGTQVVTGNVTVNATTISAAYNDTKYTYFRMIGIQTFSSAGNMYMETGEWSITFSRNTIAYSYDGIKWTGVGANIFTSYGLEVAWSGSMWVAVGGGTNTIAYSYDGINWVGLGKSVLSGFGHAIAWNGTMWVAPGTGSDSLAYSYDGINWTGLGNTTFGSAFGIAWNGRMWVAVGGGTNTIAYSYDGITWVGLGASILTNGVGVAWNGVMWVAIGGSTNTIAYSYDGINWTGLGTSIFSSTGRKLSWNGTMWIAGGVGTNTLAYSYNGINWIGLGTSVSPDVCYSASFNSARPHRITFPTSLTVATGSGTNTLAYSSDGINWTGSGLGIFSGGGAGVATNGSMWVATGYGTNTLAYSTTDIETPYIYIPFENGSYADVMGNSNVAAYGSVSYIMGARGSTAVNLINTAGNTANNYIRGTWSGANNFTVSGWFNPQTLNSTYQIIFSAYNTYFAIFINPSNQFTALVPSGGGSNYVNVGTSSTLTINTWYYFSVIFQTNGACSIYLNNVLLGSITNSQGVGSLTTSAFEISGYDSNQSYSFNGFIDDMRIYNYAITINPKIIWRGLGTSIFSSQGKGVAWSGSMWVAVGGGTNSIAYSYDGITWIGLGTVIFTQGNGVAWNGSMWVAVGNGTNSIAYSYNGINWTGLGTTGTGIFQTQGNGVAWNGFMWVAVGSGKNIINYSYNGINWNSSSIVFVPTGYLQLDNSSVDTFGNLTSPTMVGTVTYSNSIYKVGSYSAYFNNTAGSNTPANYITYTTPTSLRNPAAITISFWMNPTVIPSSVNNAVPLLLNTGSSQAVDFSLLLNDGRLTASYNNTAGSGALLYSLSALPTSAWTHVIFTYSIVNGNGVGTLYINGVLQASNTLNGSYNLGIVATGLPITTLTLGCFSPNRSAYAGYIDDVRIYTDALSQLLVTTLYNSPSQLYLSETPLIFTSSGNGVAWNGTRWVVVGSGTNTIVYSTNGINWTPATSCFTTSGNGVSWNGTRWFATGSGTNTIGYSLDGSVWSSVSQYITSNQTSLASNTWVQNGVSWTASASSSYTSNYPAYGAFNNYYGNAGVYSWASPVYYNTTTGAYTLGPATSPVATTTTVQGVGTLSGEWLQIQSSVPLVLSSYTYACGANGQIPKTYYIVGSNDNTNWYPIQSCVMTVNPLTTFFTTCSTYIIVNQSGTQTIIGGQTGSGTFTTYPPYTTNAYTYFRLIGLTLWSTGSYGNMEFCELYYNFSNLESNRLMATSYSTYGVTPYNGASIITSTRNIRAYQISLVAASSQYLLASNFIPTTNGLTFSFWYKSNALTGAWQRIFDFGNGASSDNILCSPNSSDGTPGRLEFMCFSGANSSNILLTDNNYNDNVWRHVAWTLVYAAAGSATSTWNIYLNGVLKTTATAKYYPSTSVTRTSSYIGRSNWGDPYYNGVIDDFRIYNKVLTSQQVNAIYLGSEYSSIFSTSGSNIASNNTLSGTVNIQHPVIAVGQGTHSLAYSPDGVRWTGLGTVMFNTGYGIAWNGSKWIAGGLGTNTLAYSYDGVRWTGLGATIFSTQVNGVAWNGSIWVAVGSGTNAIAYSSDGLAWTGSPTANVIFTSCNAVAWNGIQWLAVGAGTNSIAYSADGFTWTGVTGSSIFSTQGNSICWTGSLWVAVGTGTNSIAYSTDGLAWTGLGTSIFSTSGNGVCWNGTRWVAVGTGSSHTLAYSTNGTTWFGFGKTIFPSSGNSVCWTSTRFVAVGADAVISYSQDGLTWYTASGVFTQGNGVAGNPRIGAVVCDSQVALSDSTTLDVVSDTYYNTGYTNFSATIQSQTYTVDTSSAAAVVKTQPGAPTNVSGALYPSGAATGIRVSFTYPTNTGGGVDAYYASAIDIASVQPTVTVSSPSQPITITGIVPGTTYRFQVYSSNSAGQSTATVSASNLFFQIPPSAPQNYSVVLDPPTNPTGITVSFTAPSNLGGGITNYTVAAYQGSTQIGSTQTGTALSYTFTGFTAGTAYNFSAYGTNTGGIGVVSNQFITYYTKPDAPTVSSVTLDPPNTPSGVNVAFTTNGTNGGGTLTYVATAYDSSLAVVSSTTGSTSPLKITGLTPGTSYTYRVVASNPSVSSVASAAFGPTTYYTQPDAPSIQSLTNDTSNPAGVNVAFTTNGYAGGGILSYVATAYSGASAISSSAPSSTSPVKVTGLIAGTPYTFKVVASNALVSSVASASSSSLTYYTKSGAPTGISAALQPAADPTGVNVSFTAPSNLGGGNLTYVATAYSGSTAISSSAASGTSPLYIASLTAGTPYTFSVVASHGDVSSDASAAVSLTYYTRPSLPRNLTASAVFISGSNQWRNTYTWAAPASPGGTITSYTLMNDSSFDVFTYASNVFSVDIYTSTRQGFYVYATNNGGFSSGQAYQARA